MSSEPAAHCALPHSRVLQAQSLAPESVGPPHPVPASAPPLFLPPELGGPWGLTSLHRKRNRSHHLPLPVTSLVTGPSSPRDLRLLLKLRVPCPPSWGFWLTGPLGYPHKYRGLHPCFLFFLTSLFPWTPSTQHGGSSLQLTLSLLKHIFWDKKGSETLESGPGSSSDCLCDLEPVAPL